MKQKLLTSLTGMFLIVALVVPSTGFAQSTTNTAQLNTISTLLQQIQSIQAQIETLKASQQTLKSQAATEIGNFVKSLSLGSQGDDVKTLQALLASNSNIYPEGLITGFFGKATENAVKRLQKENGIDQAGSVGPKTRQLLNKLLGKNPLAFEHDEDHASTTKKSNQAGGGDKRPCAIVPPGHLIAPGWLKKNDGIKPIVPPCQTLPKGIEKKVEGDWKPATTTPDTIAPTVSNVNATNIASTTASVFWTTTEPATSKVYYGTTTPLVLSAASTLTVSNATPIAIHLLSLSGLSTSTTYRFVVESKDAAQNTATSSELSFTTLSQ